MDAATWDVTPAGFAWPKINGGSGLTRPHLQSCFSQRLSAARTTLLVIGTNRHWLQGGLDQAQCNAKVVEPVLDFLFHGLPPLREMLVGASSVAFSYIDSSPKSYVLLE